MLSRLFLALAVILVLLVGGIWWDGWLSRIDRVHTRVDGRTFVIELHRQHGAYYLRSHSDHGQYALIRVADVDEFPAEPMLTLKRKGRELIVNAGDRRVRYNVSARGVNPKNES